MRGQLLDGSGARSSGRARLTFAFLDTPLPIAFAHRGGGAEGENALAAFRASRELGYRYMETDVRTSRDGVPMIFHDEDLRRMTGHAGRVDDLTSAEIAQLALPRGDAVPTLAETLEAFPDLNFNIDLKDAAGVEPVVRVLHQAGALQRVCITSFSERRLKAARRLLGAEVCTGLGVGGSLRFGLESLLPGGGRNRKAAVLQLPFRWHGAQLVTTGVVKRAHAAGLALHVWTLNDESDINLALNVGVDGVMTDRPRLLKEVMVSRGLWQADAPSVGGSEGRFTPSG